MCEFADAICTHSNLKSHDPVWFEGGASLEGFLPSGFYEFAGDGFVIEGGRNVSIMGNSMGNLVLPSRLY